MVPKYPAARARINRNGSDSSGSEISCDTGTDFMKYWLSHGQTGPTLNFDNLRNLFEY